MPPITSSTIKQADAHDLPKLTERFVSEDGWYDGDLASVYARTSQAYELSKRLTGAMSGNPNDNQWIALHDANDQLEAHTQALEAIATDLNSFDEKEYLESLPGGTIARDYNNLIEGGLVDLGIDDGSFLYRAAKSIQVEAQNYDWDTFQQLGAQEWVIEQQSDSPEMLKHELITRAAAIDYAKDKTMVLLDAHKRAQIIDGFVTNAEISRRQAMRDFVDERISKRASTLRAAKQADAVDKLLEGMPEFLWF